MKTQILLITMISLSFQALTATKTCDCTEIVQSADCKGDCTWSSTDSTCAAKTVDCTTYTTQSTCDEQDSCAWSDATSKCATFTACADYTVTVADQCYSKNNTCIPGTVGTDGNYPCQTGSITCSSYTNSADCNGKQPSDTTICWYKESIVFAIRRFSQRKYINQNQNSLEIEGGTLIFLIKLQLANSLFNIIIKFIDIIQNICKIDKFELFLLQSLLCKNYTCSQIDISKCTGITDQEVCSLICQWTSAGACAAKTCADMTTSETCITVNLDDFSGVNICSWNTSTSVCADAADVSALTSSNCFDKTSGYYYWDGSACSECSGSSSNGYILAFIGFIVMLMF